MNEVEKQTVKPLLMLISDFGVHTGFSTVATNLAHYLKDVFSLVVIGINYFGDPITPNPDIPVYSASGGGRYDMWGLNRFRELVPLLRPDAVLMISDPWIAVRFTEIERGDLPLCNYTPIDAQNISPAVGQLMNRLDLCIFYTHFGETECRRAGFTGPSEIVPHGVRTDLYIPLNRDYCRARLNFSQALLPGAFIFGNVNRNSPRKRQDLSIEYFAEWVHNYHIPQNVYLYLHCAQHDTAGIDPAELAWYYGVDKRIIMPPEDSFTPAEGFPEWQMPLVYNCFDVAITTTSGEGWGLSQLEAMACGLPQIMPHNSALAEWASGAALFVPASQHTCHPIINTIGSIPDKVPFIQALDRMYRDASLRSKYGALALQRAREPRFQWRAVADEFKRHLGKILIDKREAVAKREAEKKEKEQDGQV